MAKNTSAPDQVVEETAFLIIKRNDGSFYATPDLSTSLTVGRAASRQDMKTGCRDILDAIHYSDLSNITANAVWELLKPKAEESVPGSIREALDERGIL